MLHQTTGKRIGVSSADFDMFERELRTGLKLEAEHAEADGHLDKVIDKPWGHEYRIYADHFYDIWKLRIRPNQSTSLHCHPRKETVLICLSGQAEVRFINHSIEVEAPNYVYIDRGVFHSTTNTGLDDLHLVEIETPRNKLDLVRAQDRYGRARAQYEQENIPVDTPNIETSTLISGSKIRPGDCSGRYQFRVQNGRELAEGHHEGTACAIALGVRQALGQDIQVLLPDQIAVYPFRDEQLYFSIVTNF
jgi:mannose-6-phosphate isomerase-like protein (cupin superfamily)